MSFKDFLNENKDIKNVLKKVQAHFQHPESKYTLDGNSIKLSQGSALKKSDIMIANKIAEKIIKEFPELEIEESNQGIIWFKLKEM